MLGYATRQPSALSSRTWNPAALATVTVHVVNFAFTPDPVTIHVGDTVHWVWDTPNHSTTSVVGSAESWDSGIHGVGFTFDHTFTHAGTFVYYCVVHGSDNGNGTASGMAGTINVQATGTLTSITLMPANPSVAVGATEQFMAMGVFSDGTTQDVTSQATWASANSAVATISNASGSKGLATGVATGTPPSPPLSTASPAPQHLQWAELRHLLCLRRSGDFKSSGLKIQAKVDKTLSRLRRLFPGAAHFAPELPCRNRLGRQFEEETLVMSMVEATVTFAIIGQHRYVRHGVFDITVTIRDSAFRKIATQSLVRVVP